MNTYILRYFYKNAPMIKENRHCSIVLANTLDDAIEKLKEAASTYGEIHSIDIDDVLDII